MKKQTKIFKNKIGLRLLIFGLLLVFILGSSYLWWQDATSPVSRTDTDTQNFSIEKGDGIRNIISNLKNSGLIKDQVGFFIQIKLLNLDNQIQAGNFRLSKSMDSLTIAKLLTHGVSDVRVTIREGLRNEEIASLFNVDPFLIPQDAILKIAKAGYLFPDTYDFQKDATAGAVIDKLTLTFNEKVTAEIRQKIKDKGLTFEEGIILASIVEREGRNDTDRPIIAGILLKRLKNDWPLQTDATLQYALGYQANDKTWWKKQLTVSDKKIRSAYNTYLNIGLPPLPICNPGLNAIKAVAEAANTEYWYYLHDEAGEAHYAKTLKEHEANISKYLMP